MYDPCSFFSYFSSSEKDLNYGDSNSELCNAGAVLYQFSFQGNWELVVMWVDDKPVDDGYESK